MKDRIPIITTCLIGAGSQAGGQSIEVRLAEMLARIEQLEAMTQQQPEQPPSGGVIPMGPGNPPRNRPMPGMGSSGNSKQGGMSGMSGMGAVNPPFGSAPGAGGGVSPIGRQARLA